MACPNCGAEFNDNRRFCGKCGSEMNALRADQRPASSIGIASIAATATAVAGAPVAWSP